MDEGGVEGLVDGGVEAFLGGAGVSEDDVGVLAAEFERDLLDRVGGGARHLRTAGESAGEGHEVDVGVFGEAGADGVAGARDEARDTGGQPGLGQQTEQRDGGQRGDLARLDHEGVAGGEGRSDLPTGLQERIVPGRDQRAHADGFVHDDAVDVGGPGVHHAPAALPHHEVGEVAEGVGDAVDVDAPLFQGLARVPALQQAEFLAVADEEVGDAAQQGGAVGDGGVRPGALVEGAAGGRDGEVRVLLVTLRDHGERLGIGGVEDLARRAGERRAPLAAHVDGLFCLVSSHDRCCLPFLFDVPVSRVCHSREP